MGIYFKLAPGVRVRIAKRGVRTSIGPRAARLHVGGGYRPGVSTGAGPVTVYHGVGANKRRKARTASGSSQRRSAPAAYQRQRVGAVKASQASGIAAVLRTITDLHRRPVNGAVRPVAAECPPIDESAIRKRQLKTARKGIGIWKRPERKNAARQAAIGADADIAAARTAREAQRRQVQARLDEQWRKLLANDPVVVLAALKDAFKENATHARAVTVNASELTLVVFVAGTEIVPERLPATTEAGNLSLRKMTQSQSAGFYTTAVCGQVLAAVRQALAAAPGLDSVRAAAARVGAIDVYGKSRSECLAAATFTRAELDKVDWTNAASPAIFDQCAHHVTVTMTDRVKHLEPIDLTGQPALAALIAAIDIEP